MARRPRVGSCGVLIDAGASIPAEAVGLKVKVLQRFYFPDHLKVRSLDDNPVLAKGTEGLIPDRYFKPNRCPQRGRRR